MAALSDGELLDEIERLATAERVATVRLLAALGELERRRLYLEAGCSSLFTYCTEVLHLSEHAAYRRMQAARAARAFPAILGRLASGGLTLTAVGLLAPHLTAGNCEELLDEAHHRTKRELEQIVARVAPKPDVPEMIRRLPAPRQVSCACQGLVAGDCATHVIALPAAVDARDPRSSADVPVVDGHAPEPPSVLTPESGLGATGAGPRVPGPYASFADSPEPVRVGGPVASHEGPGQAVAADAEPLPPTATTRPVIVAPVAPGRYRVQLTISAGTYSKLSRVQDLMRHLVPDGNLEAVFDRAITVLLGDLERARLAAALRPRDSAGAPAPGSRRVPAAVKRAVWARDGGRCAFVGTAGRCRETGFLQFHHRKPFAVGGETTAENLELRCAAHNAFEAERFFSGQERSPVGTRVPGLARHASGERAADARSLGRASAPGNRRSDRSAAERGSRGRIAAPAGVGHDVDPGGPHEDAGGQGDPEDGDRRGGAGRSGPDRAEPGGTAGQNDWGCADPRRCAGLSAPEQAGVCEGAGPAHADVPGREAGRGELDGDAGPAARDVSHDALGQGGPLRDRASRAEASPDDRPPGGLPTGPGQGDQAHGDVLGNKPSRDVLAHGGLCDVEPSRRAGAHGGLADIERSVPGCHGVGARWRRRWCGRATGDRRGLPFGSVLPHESAVRARRCSSGETSAKPPPRPALPETDDG